MGSFQRPDGLLNPESYAIATPRSKFIEIEPSYSDKHSSGIISPALLPEVIPSSVFRQKYRVDGFKKIPSSAPNLPHKNRENVSFVPNSAPDAPSPPHPLRIIESHESLPKLLEKISEKKSDKKPPLERKLSCRATKNISRASSSRTDPTRLDDCDQVEGFRQNIDQCSDLRQLSPGKPAQPSKPRHFLESQSSLSADQRTSSVCSEKLRLYKTLLQEPRTEMRAKYKLGVHLGEGASGVVRQCTERATGEIFACKSIPKESLKSQLDIEDLVAELETMEALQGHPYCVKLEDYFEDHKNIHIVLEMCTGGDLFTRIKRLRKFSEKEAAIVTYKLACVLDYAHTKGIMHRDLKPENILMATPDSNTDIRLADFGSATFFKPGQNLNQLIGSPLYIAPSVLNHNYGPEADLWSLGVVLFILLCGVPPFWGPTNADIFKKVMFADLQLSGSRWFGVSNIAKDLVCSLLTRDENLRLTAREVQDHPWIRHHCRHLREPTVGFGQNHFLAPVTYNQNIDSRLSSSVEDRHRRGSSLEPHNSHNFPPRRSVLDRSPTPFARMPSTSSTDDDQSSSILGDNSLAFPMDEDDEIPVAPVVLGEPRKLRHSPLSPFSSGDFKHS